MPPASRPKGVRGDASPNEGVSWHEATARPARRDSLAATRTPITDQMGDEEECNAQQCVSRRGPRNKVVSMQHSGCHVGPIGAPHLVRDSFSHVTGYNLSLPDMIEDAPTGDFYSYSSFLGFEALTMSMQ